MKKRMRTEYRMQSGDEVVHTFDPTDVAYAQSVVPDVSVASQKVMHGTWRVSA